MCNSVPVAYFKAMDKYYLALNEVLSEFSKQIKKEFELFKHNPKTEKFYINEVCISLQELTILLGDELFNSIHFGDRWFFYSEEAKRKTFWEVEDYIRSIPGAVLPEVPKTIKEWLKRI
ncbi:MAG: hypothetical protein US83_C0006G0084 [Candidatus Falkowbacteria bacterium GW2011_GWC2_38_22]|uniref:Uncharacterized protein n=1 Tax=Candidatus Falkowbacteria bacterium GW2011_GWE1_38_31 TaxID=1618638 RepID=A0A0G0K6G7_9BACT|nr:MAG: hypothetical protein US73_C0001G0002 [Candidatus Falkowbacteria bacterium GW2011_GWF2_38_1205]KKQ61444.1 MAG: hypothetical protein US83_C0006G0084 [Candidatus Falkowbacteria bacterium GW2011_GWC2_38_22]KKQ63970.1 MAG: hypothetical protein US84_C0002G0002 [Candidatus Falkowbacteria bacterium GW2011_GWF1_38_22]KKQ66681.1 MAG: hypothetical protein US87_C0001G0202 [Candidatus Falkowbacteria bacterium GW2011_GWE2_38_254]KKQ71075.1 MAG: hypothetical protein US91_C0001G0002 [Candidatus Falkowb